MKPIELIAKAVINSTKKGEIVLDCFGGSGCERYDTKCIEKRVKLATIKPISREFTDEDYKNVMAMPKNKERTELGNVFDNTIKYVKKLLGAGE